MKEENILSVDERKALVASHIIANLGATMDDAQILEAEGDLSFNTPIDLIVVKPHENFDYYVVSTVGLSDYYFNKGLARAELSIVLPKTWKIMLDKHEYAWPFEMLSDIAESVVNAGQGVAVGQVYTLSKPTNSNTVYGGVVTFPEMMPLNFVEEKIGITYTRFFLVVPVSKEQLDKIDSVGIDDFIEYDLHDTDGPLMVAEYVKATNSTLDKIIAHNENSLKGN